MNNFFFVFQLPLLPDEMITEIISYLHEIDDIQNCMLVSKHIRNLILKSSKIISKIRFVFKISATNEEVSEFLSEYGCVMKSLKIKKIPFLEDLKGYKDPNPQLVRFLLSHTPNLEEFAFHSEKFGAPGLTSGIFDMPKLKSLTISSNDIENFIKSATNLKNIKSLTVSLKDLSSNDILRDFIFQFKDLKELSLLINSRTKFSSHNISHLVPFRLTKLEVHSQNDDELDKNFLEFLKTQAATLKELRISGELDYECIDFIFINCKGLDSLAFNLRHKNINQLLSLPKPEWTSTKLKNFDCGYLKLKLLFSKFPNIKTISCCGLINSTGTFSSLESLEVSILACDSVFFFKLPNLTKLTVSHNMYGQHWKEFTETVPNLEHFVVKHFKSDSFFKDVLEYLKIGLKYWKNFKTLKIISHDKERWIFMEFSSQTIKLHKSLSNEKEILRFLKKSFGNFEVVYK